MVTRDGLGDKISKAGLGDTGRTGNKISKAGLGDKKHDSCVRPWTPSVQYCHKTFRHTTSNQPCCTEESAPRWFHCPDNPLHNFAFLDANLRGDPALQLWRLNHASWKNSFLSPHAYG